MKKTKFTLLQSKSRFMLYNFALLVAMTLGNMTTATAECSLACNTNTQVSLDEYGDALITPATLLNADASSCPDGDFEVRVYFYGTTIEIPSSPNVTCEYVGEQLTVGIWDLISGNNCWGIITVEDKLPPVFECPSDTMVIGCAEMVSFSPFVEDNCDDNPTLQLISETEVLLDCDTLYIKRITRTYQATDNQGNVSAPCTMVLNLERIELDDVLFPISWDIAAGNYDPISCSSIIPLDENGHPDPLYTGVPTLYGDSLWPNSNTFCNSGTFYTDLVIPQVNGCNKKIMRTWSVREWWCSQELERAMTQVIEIVDRDGPSISCSNEINATTTPSGCDVHIVMPQATVFDSCSEDITVKMTYPGGFLNSNGGLITLPVGTTVVTYTAYDECYNSNFCTVTVNVVDHTPPVAVCVQYTAVSLTIGGESWIPAASFDDGSFDECIIDKVLVKRMDDGARCGLPNFEFSESVPVCCADIGQETMIILRAYDKAGNFNDCMINVDVQDKLAPTIICPDDLEVNCDTYYDPENLAATFGNATAFDNCDYVITETSVYDFNACGLGTITRTFTATDAGDRTSTCDQVIYFYNDDAFEYEDITWPANHEEIGCLDPASLSPDVLGYPTYDEDQCDLVGANYTDEVFYFNQPGAPACFKIIRHWAVIDWCQFDPHNNGQYMIWRKDQIIKVINNIDPEITSSCDPLSTCTYDADCQDGYIELVSTATDDCTIDSEIEWEYKIDYNKDGNINSTHSGTGAIANASGTHPVGAHSIAWIFYDRCGNNVTCVQDFDIVNCKAPTPYCYNGLAIDLMPIDTNNDGTPDEGMVETWASDFDAGSSHPCGYRVILSFEQDTTIKARTFTCADVGQQTVKLYTSVLTPTGLIQAYCETYVDIQDNTNVCPDNTNLVNVSGIISTEDDAKIDEVEVVLESAEDMMSMTNTEGSYSFPNMPTGGSYTLNPNSAKDPMNGVSTLDLILIQRHILLLKELDSPYKIIASDVNNDGVTSTKDLIELRKLILGKTESFDNNTSWRFINKEFDFEGENPLELELPESYYIEGLNSDMNVDFVAVKVGDVNNTISDNLLSNNSDDRNVQTLQLQTSNQSFVAGEKVTVDINSLTDVNLNGYQFTLNFDNSALQYEGVVSNSIKLDEGNIGLDLIDRGVITTSWNENGGIAINSNKTMFSLTFIATKAGNTDNMIEINSEVVTAEAYDIDNNIMNINYNMTNSIAEGYELFQNTPNPFSQVTSIAFNLPTENTVSLKIYDVTGRMISEMTDTYPAGRHAVQIDKKDINTTGVLYYTLETENFTATKRMVILK